MRKGVGKGGVQVLTDRYRRIPSTMSSIWCHIIGERSLGAKNNAVWRVGRRFCTGLSMGVVGLCAPCDKAVAEQLIRARRIAYTSSPASMGSPSPTMGRRA